MYVPAGAGESGRTWGRVGLRGSVGARGLEADTDIRTIQTLLGHHDLRTTMIYRHVRGGALGVQSPLDRR